MTPILFVILIVIAAVAALARTLLNSGAWVTRSFVSAFVAYALLLILYVFARQFVG